MVSSIIWALVTVLIVLLINHRYGQWIESRKPLQLVHYEELKLKLQDLQKQVSTLSVKRGFE